MYWPRHGPPGKLGYCAKHFAQQLDAPQVEPDGCPGGRIKVENYCRLPGLLVEILEPALSGAELAEDVSPGHG